MGTIIENPVQDLNAFRNRDLTGTKSPGSFDKVPEKDRASNPGDRLQAQSLRNQIIEANRASLETSVQDVDEARELLREVEGMLNSENMTSRVEAIHDFSEKNLVDLLS